MKNKFLSLAIAAVAVAISTVGAVAQTTNIKIDPKKSTVKWFAEKVTGKHDGTVNVQTGALTLEGNKLVSGTVVMDMSTIACRDLEDPEYNGKLVGHLKSDDFFGVAKHPTSTLQITKVTPIANAKAGENNYTITGVITIKGISQEVSFPAKMEIKNGTLTANGTMILDRSKFDVRYGSKSFFDGLGDKVIYDEFRMEFNVVASK